MIDSDYKARGDVILNSTVTPMKQHMATVAVTNSVKSFSKNFHSSCIAICLTLVKCAFPEKTLHLTSCSFRKKWIQMPICSVNLVKYSNFLHIGNDCSVSIQKFESNGKTITCSHAKAISVYSAINIENAKKRKEKKGQLIRVPSMKIIYILLYNMNND